MGVGPDKVALGIIEAAFRTDQEGCWTGMPGKRIARRFAASFVGKEQRAAAKYCQPVGQPGLGIKHRERRPAALLGRLNHLCA